MKNNAIILMMIVLGFSVLLWSGPALGQTMLIEPKSPEDIKYISGGVGEQERQSLEQAADQYNLKLVFATEGGAYVSHVDVRIESLEGEQETVLETRTQGPWFYAQLPPGRYNVTASYDNQQKSETLQVESGLNTAFFQWPR